MFISKSIKYLLNIIFKSISCVFNSNQRASKLHFRNICNVRRSSWKVSKEGKLKSNIFIKIRAHRLLKS